MTIKYKLCTLLIMLLTASAQAAVNPPIVATPKAKAFFRDDQLWTLTLNTKTHKYEIPVCWENLTEINNTTLHPAVSPRLKTWKQRRVDIINYANAAWGDTTVASTNPVGEGSPSLLFFVDKGQCPPARSTSPAFPGVRVLASSTLKLPLPLPFPDLSPPYVKALGNKLNNLYYGLVLDFDLKNTSIKTRCQSQLISEENCFKATVIHEFGHVLGMSHEQNRNDEPLILDTCALNDPNPVNGFLSFGNLRIGAYDTQSIMAYCNPNRLKNPVLSAIDKTALRVFYGRMPSISNDLGYPVITIPVVYRGITKAPYSLQLSDPTKTGKFKSVFSIAPTTGKSSIPATYSGSVLSIPYLKVTSFGKVTGLQRKSMTFQTATGFFASTNTITLYPVNKQP
jgi:Astacin (Peptidase family M12A)